MKMEAPQTKPPIEYWQQKEADAYRAAYYAARQKELAELALSSQLQLQYEEHSD